MSRIAWKASMASAFWPAAFAVVANVPARYAMALREHQFGYGTTTTLVLAVLADIACLGPLFALTLAPLDWLMARRPDDRSTSRRALAAVIVVTVGLAAVMWVVSVAATEFRIQRGTYPALAETLEGLSDPDFIRGSARIALFERYSWPTMAALFALAGLLAIHAKVRLRRSHDTTSPLHTVAGIVIGSLEWTALASILLVLLRGVLPEPVSDAWIPPIVRLAAEARPAVDRKPGVRAVLASIDLGESTARSGLHWLGFGDAHARCLAGDADPSCAPHPLARPLPGDDFAPDARREHPTPLVGAFLELSAALFGESAPPLVVWHLTLESFRADDVRALHPAAPAEIAPFINAAYAPSRPGGPQAIAFRHAFQSGLRTAHAVSGLWCGLGALPFQLAVSRDLVDLPLRCMPDVLRDAGFATRLYYGANASFEHLGDFAVRHGLQITDVSTLSPGLPRGAFRAVTDAALLAVALRDSAEAGPLAYRFVLTLSGHSPFDLPEDVSAETQTRVGNAIAAHFDGPVAAEHRSRLVTMAYTDDAIAAFVREVERSTRGAQSLFVISGDHATADPFLWGEPTGEALARVPFILYLPTALIAGSKNPARVEDAVRSLDVLASTLPVSINDVPTLLLALLAHHPALTHLSRARRWHTLGGATSSPYFAARDATTAQVWGIDASSRIFLVHRGALDQLEDTRERSVAFSIWEEPLGPVLKDVAGALSGILRACTAVCSDAAIRKTCCNSQQESISD